MAGSPVVLIHGWGGSFQRTYREPGWEALLQDGGCEVIGVDLLGHGTAPKPHDPAEYGDLSARVVEALPDRPVSGVGFSLGAMTLLGLAAREPHRFDRVVFMGIGRNVFEIDEERHRAVLAALDGTGGADDVGSQVFAQYANQPGNDPKALAAIFRRPARPPVTAEQLSTITCPALVVIGDRDFAGPGDQLAAALPNSRLVVLKNTDHFATTESFKAIDAVLEFLGALPT